MDWYEKLNEYFPAEEMKSREHFERLMKEKEGLYVKEESPNHVLIYYEAKDYIFVDYIIVTGSIRGRGLGSSIMGKLMSKNKAIILEVDPIDTDDPETIKRVRFYERLGFTHAKTIDYKRRHIITNQLNVMDVFYWSHPPVTEQWVYKKMGEIYNEVHAYQAKAIYGKSPQSTQEVLHITKQTISHQLVN
ncbi:MAG TPA: GNAT family N-acetyltransferase [Chondromyces sp.]|nr:GNAT family N-acetyltransferase [Chondromyces sp.]